MPWGDGTGPAGMGPMTGRAGGYCAGYNAPGYAGGFGGRGSRGGFGGRGFRNWYNATGVPGLGRYNAGYPGWGGFARNPYFQDIGPEQEKEMLKRESGLLQSQLDEIKTRMDELSGEEKDKK
jgi:hypothetical protein